MAWIDYKKAYDMVPLSRIIYGLKIYKISDEVINFIDKTMKTWRVEMTGGGRRLAEDPKRDFPRRCSITLNIHNCHDAT